MALRREEKTTGQYPAIHKNRYLADQSAGLELVSRIISANPPTRAKEYKVLDQLIDEKLLSFSENLDLEDELDLYARLIAISDRLMTPIKYQILTQKSVVGLGGKFSAGKSAFLNSLLGDEFQYQLPVKQTPSTSVPTYIISGEKSEVFACTSKGARFPLDADAVDAISHDFQTTYGLGLAQYLSFIAIHSPGIWEQLALLDTPGYNKADSGALDSYTDSQKAYAQLRAIDYLIWLVDVSNGTLTQDDITFIRRLELKTKVLIVVNKCDLKTEEARADVLYQARESAQEAGILIFDVVSYSSYKPDLDGGREKVQAFFQYARQRESQVEALDLQVREISEKIETAFTSTMDRLKDAQNKIGNAISRSADIFEIRSLIDMYGAINSDIADMRDNRKAFKRTEQRILRMISKMNEVPYD